MYRVHGIAAQILWCCGGSVKGVDMRMGMRMYTWAGHMGRLHTCVVGTGVHAVAVLRALGIIHAWGENWGWRMGMGDMGKPASGRPEDGR